MRSIYEVIRHKEADVERLKKEVQALRQKEADIERLREELQALRVAAPMLEDEPNLEVQPAPLSVSSVIEPQARPVSVAPSTRPVWP